MPGTCEWKAFKPFGNNLTVFGFQFLHIPGVICASRTFGEWSGGSGFVRATNKLQSFMACTLECIYLETIAMHFCRAKMGGKIPLEPQTWQVQREH